MIIVDTVAILNNEQVAMIILIHKEEFLKLIIVSDCICPPVQTVQSIVGLNPVSFISRIHNIVNQITG